MANLTTPVRSPNSLAKINGKHHRLLLNFYMFIVVAHWAEHLVQAFQIWVLGMSRPDSRGVLGHFYPWLVSSEWLHYGYAIIMLIGLFLLLPGFVGRARNWWLAALIIQFWHHVEHLLLLIQVQAGVVFFGAESATSILQLVVGRVELHLFYNSVVFIPMMIAVYRHLRPNQAELAAANCTCAGPRRPAAPMVPVA